MEGENNNNNENNMEWEAARAEPAPDEPRVNDDHDPPQNVEQDDQLPRNNDGSLNGGVAVPPESNKVRAAECELMLFLECREAIQGHESNPVLQPDTTVCIGLDKTTKLVAVFERYVGFANEHALNKNNHLLRLEDLEFVHCTVLRHHDTSEASALMKNDRIRVQQTRSDERALAADLVFLQQNADRHYFDNLRGLMTDLMGSCDILLDCQGKLVDENGLNQEVLRTTLRGHSAILAKRCKWLGRLIQKTREELERKSVVTIPDNEHIREDLSRSIQHVAPPAESDDGDDGIEALPYPAEARDNSRSQGATEIENDDDEEALSVSATSRSGSPVLSSASGANMLWVTIPNHPPEAVKLLLEYCYTNCVIPLGQDAFEVSWYSVAVDGHSRVRPTRQWPEKSKHPRVSFATALAGISLAEEASLPRLSLMCEVAASNLVESPNVVEALSMCTRQEEQTGNQLKRLRKAAMAHVLKRRGVDHLCRTQTFKRAISEPARSAAFVPSVLTGTMEAMVSHDNQKQQETKQVAVSRRTQERYEELDKEDAFHREMERRKHRAQRKKSPLFNSNEEVVPNKNAFVKWEGVSSQASKKSLKRTSHGSWVKKSRQSRKHGKGSRSDKWTVRKL